MHASPSLQEIASALARTSVAPTVRSASRILCLKLHEQSPSGFKRSKRTGGIQAVVEAFLKYSPRVQYRSVACADGDSPHWVFIDIASTSHLFHGEESLMRSAVSLARDLGFGVQSAVSDTPSGAQAFALAFAASDKNRDGVGSIIPPGEERERLKNLSLPFLLHLEGLQPWTKPSMVENIITFFMMLGFKTAGDLSRFSVASLQERWGETGELLWKRLNAQDRQPISPLLPTSPLEDYVHLDFPVTIVSLLLHQAQKSVDFLFARLQGRRLFARKLILTLHCEYSEKHYRLEIEPSSPSRDRDLFVTLLENKLGEMDLENPIRDFELHVLPCPEKSQQLDFFEPRSNDDDKMQSLMSLLTQSSLKPGLYRIEPSVRPERGWRLASASEPGPVAGIVHQPSSVAAAIGQSLTSMAYVAAPQTGRYESAYSEGATAIAPMPHYGASVMEAPRPTRILKVPQPLTISELQRMNILTSNPIERLENGWWENDEMKRDYYFAVSSEGQCLWIYQDLKTEEYFLHGYFD